MDVYDAIRALCFRGRNSIITFSFIDTKRPCDGIKITDVECKYFAAAQTTRGLNRHERLHFLSRRSYRNFDFLCFQHFLFIQGCHRGKINVGMIPFPCEKLIPALIYSGGNHGFHHANGEIYRMRRLRANTLYKLAQVFAIDRFQRQASKPRCLKREFHRRVKGCERRSFHWLPFSRLQFCEIVLRASFERGDHRFAFTAARITSRAHVEAVFPSDCAAFWTALSSAFVNVAVTRRLRTSAAFIGGRPNSLSFFPKGFTSVPMVPQFTYHVTIKLRTAAPYARTLRG